MSAPDAADNCACGHPEVWHETVVREGLAWFATDGFAEMLGSDALAKADAEERIWLYCSECNDGCRRVALTTCPESGDSGETT